MTYSTPELMLVGAAQNLVLSFGKVAGSRDNSDMLGQYDSNPGLSNEAEW